MKGLFCPRYHHAVELIGKRWTGAILRAMFAGASRFCELTGAVPELSDRMLSERLKELEAEGIVQRTVQPDARARVAYRLTKKGRALEPVLDALAAWAESWVPAPDTEDGGADEGGPESRRVGSLTR